MNATVIKLIVIFATKTPLIIFHAYIPHISFEVGHAEVKFTDAQRILRRNFSNDLLILAFISKCNQESIMFIEVPENARMRATFIHV